MDGLFLARYCSTVPTREREHSFLLADPTLRSLLLVVLFTYTAQNMLNASIAPLSRDLHLPEWMIGMAVSAAALAVALLSQFWGRRCVAWGPRRVILIALTCALASGLLFSATVHLRALDLIGAFVAGAGIITARGPLFGSAVAAIPPTGQVLIAHSTEDSASRVAGMATFSGVINLSIMVGSLLSSALGMWWIQAPVHATPWFIALALAVAWYALPPRDSSPSLGSPPGDSVDHEGSETGEETTRSTSRAELPPRVSWKDPRLLPWMGGAFGTFFAAGVMQILAGFILQDRLGLTSQQALPATALMLLTSACGAMLMQLFIVPRLPFSPAVLLRLGATTGLIALTVLSFTSSPLALGLSAFCVGMGMGTVGPAFNAGGSLAVTPREQGGAAGVLNATGAITWIFAPATATALYGWKPISPFVLALSILLVSTLISWVFTGRSRREIVDAVKRRDSPR